MHIDSMLKKMQCLNFGEIQFRSELFSYFECFILSVIKCFLIFWKKPETIHGVLSQHDKTRC